MQNIALDIYPVGSIYLTFDSRNPSELFGGEWESIEGRFLIGVGSNTDDNNETWEFSLNQSHGEYKHQLTIQEMPSHTHAFGGYIDWYTKGSATNILGPGNSASNTSSRGGDYAHNNMPPYLAVYMWKRVS